MKKLVSVIVFIAVTLTVTAQITVSSNSKVGIGTTTPSEKLEVAGNVKVTGGSVSVTGGSVEIYGNIIPAGSGTIGLYSDRWGCVFATVAMLSSNPVIDSDAGLKKDIKDLDSVLDKIKLMRPISYKLTGSGKDDPNTNKVLYGFIAQEVQSVFPDVVENTQDSLLGIRYGDFIPVLLQAIQEQQVQIEVLQKEVGVLTSKNKN